MAASPLTPPLAALHARDAASREVPGPQLAKLQRAAAVARDRMGALPGVRVLGADVLGAAHEDGVRLAVDVRDTGRDGWRVACALAARGIAVEAAGGRALVLRMRTGDVEEGMHERLAAALLQALWATPAAGGFELVLDAPAGRAARTGAPRR
jgi:hypothetical protein